MSESRISGKKSRRSIASMTGLTTLLLLGGFACEKQKPLATEPQPSSTPEQSADNKSGSKTPPLPGQQQPKKSEPKSKVEETSDPEPKPTQIPANADPYDYDWRAARDDNRWAVWNKKAEQSAEELKKTGALVESVYEGISVTLFAKQGTSEGKIDAAVLKNLRQAGVTKLAIQFAITPAGMNEIGQFRCLQELVVFGGGKLTDVGFAGLASLKSLKIININGTDSDPLSVTGEGFRHLTKLSQLHELWVRKASVTDAGLANLSQLTSLRSLDLEQNKITDGGLAHLRGLVRLESLNLEKNSINGTGCKELAELGKLHWLMLDGDPVTDEGAEVIARLRVKELFLYGSKVTDSGAASLSKMKSLTLLRLTECPITDAAIKTLASLPNLEELHLRDTKVTGDGLQALASATKLKKVAVTKGPNVPPASIEKLKKAKPGLEVEEYN